jgi:multidrug efflux pump subunit AcrB
MISRFFIDRPVLANVLALVFVLIGLVSLLQLPTAEYPNVVPPTIQVSTRYAGASAQTLVDTVALPIEQQVNGVEDMLYMQSTSANDGTYTLTVTFEIGTDPDKAQILVQNQVSAAVASLPPAVQSQGVTVAKRASSFLSRADRTALSAVRARQALPDYRASANDIRNLRVKAGNGTMTPIGTVAEIEQVQGPLLISLYNLYPSASVVGNAAPGFSSGEALDLMDQIGEHALPTGTGYEWTAMSYQEKAVGSQIYFVFALALLLVYFVLAGQYESWILPLSVILGVPLALLGTVSALTILGAANDLYTQIGLVLLIALGSKNAILVVEYARQRRAEGMEIITAAVEGARLRFRPILMTSFAFILGVFPLVIATGAGAGARRSIGLAVFSGMIASTCLVVVFVPSFYVVMQRIQERWTRRAVPNNPPAPPHSNAL